MRSADFGRSTKESRAANLEHLVLDGRPVGVLAYVDGVPVGSCSGAQRAVTDWSAIRALAQIDDQPVWAGARFFVDRRFRAAPPDACVAGGRRGLRAF